MRLGKRSRRWSFQGTCESGTLRSHKHLLRRDGSRPHRPLRPQPGPQQRPAQTILAVATVTSGTPLHLSVLRGNLADSATSLPEAPGAKSVTGSVESSPKLRSNWPNLPPPNAATPTHKKSPVRSGSPSSASKPTNTSPPGSINPASCANSKPSASARSRSETPMLHRLRVSPKCQHISTPFSPNSSSLPSSPPSQVGRFSRHDTDVARKNPSLLSPSAFPASSRGS